MLDYNLSMLCLCVIYLTDYLVQPRNKMQSTLSATDSGTRPINHRSTLSTHRLQLQITLGVSVTLKHANTFAFVHLIDKNHASGLSQLLHWGFVSTDSAKNVRLARFNNKYNVNIHRTSVCCFINLKLKSFKSLLSLCITNLGNIGRFRLVLHFEVIFIELIHLSIFVLFTFINYKQLSFRTREINKNGNRSWKRRQEFNLNPVDL